MQQMHYFIRFFPHIFFFFFALNFILKTKCLIVSSVYIAIHILAAVCYIARRYWFCYALTWKNRNRLLFFTNSFGYSYIWLKNLESILSSKFFCVCCSSKTNGISQTKYYLQLFFQDNIFALIKNKELWCHGSIVTNFCEE